MKKLLTAFIAVLYIGLSSGFAINIHYCMGKVVSAKLESEKPEKCGKCGMSSKSGCCQDELTVLKINDSHKANYNTYSFEQTFYIAPKNYTELQVSLISRSINNRVCSSSPPDNTNPSLYILYNVFRI